MVGQEDLASRVQPVQILEDDDAGPARTLRLAEALGQPEQPALSRFGMHLGHRVLRVDHRQEVEEQRQIVGEAVVEREQRSRDPLAGRLGWIAVADPEEVPQELEDG